MKIVIGSDHRGVDAKSRLIDSLSMNYEILDVGNKSTECCDYPDIAFEVAKKVSDKECDRGILICGSGIGMSIAANKVRGIRATLCHDIITTEMSRRHNDGNVLCLSADLLGKELMIRMVNIWLTTEFDGGRHARRVEKITKFEEMSNN